MEFIEENLHNIMAKNRKALTMLQNYSVDSGFMSPVETGLVSEEGTKATPSVYQNHDELETTDLFDFDVQERFGEIYHDFEDMPTLEKETMMLVDTPKKESMKLSEFLSHEDINNALRGCHFFENTSQNLTQQDDSPIPKLIKLLCDDDLVVVNHAVEMIYELLKKQASKSAILNNPQIMRALIQTIVNSNDLETARTATKTIYFIFFDKDACRRAVMNCPEVVLMLVRATTITDDIDIQIMIIKTLENIFLEKEICENVILSCPEIIHTLQRLILNSDDEILTDFVIRVLLNVLSNNEVCQNANISSSEMATILIRIFPNINAVEHVKTALTALRSLSSDKDVCSLMNCPELIISLLGRLMHAADVEMKRLIINILHNMSSEKEILQIAANTVEEARMSVRTLSNSNNMNVNSSDTIFHTQLKEEMYSNSFFNNTEMVPNLIQTLSLANDLEIIRGIIGILHNLSNTKQGLEAIYNNKGIPVLVKFLRSSRGALVAIHNLLLFKKGSEIAVCEADGLPIMVSLLRNDNAKFLTIVTDCLYTLAYGNQENKLIILASRGPVELIRILKTFHYEKLLWNTAKVLKVLSACSKNKEAIVQVGGMQALGMHLNYAKIASPRLVQTVLWALRNLSDAATGEEGLQELLYEVIQLLSSHDEHVVTCAAGILCNLTCNNQNNKLTVFRVHGIEALIQAITAAGDIEKITDPAICALRHVTSRYSEAEMAQNEVRECFGLPIIVNLLRPTSSWPLIKAVIGLIRNLALCAANREVLRELGAVHSLTNLLTDLYQEQQKSKNFGILNGELQDGVHLEEIIEGAVGALYILARDPNNRAVIRSQQVYPIFAELLLGNNENIQKVAASIMCELG